MNFFRAILVLIFLYCNLYCLSQQNTEPSVSKIVAAEYFFDKDPGVGKGIAFQINKPDTTVSLVDSVLMTSLTPGYHTLSIRVKNAKKKWSIFQSKIIYILTHSTTSPEPKVSKIVAAEYFFDKDPGDGNGIPIVISKVDTVINFSDSIIVPFLYGKNHSLIIRTKNSKGNWSIYTISNFSLSPYDKDRDGLIDYIEPDYGTDYKIFDTNNDGLADGVNVFTGLPPLSTDTDGDGISNIQEILKGTSPILQDTDGDGVPDKKDAFPLDRYRTKLPVKNLSDHAAPLITLNEPPL